MYSLAAQSICSSSACLCNPSTGSAITIFCHRKLNSIQQRHFETLYDDDRYNQYERISSNSIEFSCDASKSLKIFHCSNISPLTPIHIHKCVYCNSISWIGCENHIIHCIESAKNETISSIEVIKASTVIITITIISTI